MKKFYVLLTVCFFATKIYAQLSIPSIGTPVTIDFSGFAGLGFQPGGGAGYLNSDEWSASGFSDGDVLFGGTGTSGDFARGSTMGGVINGGIYAVDILGNQGLMVQPVDADFTPGSFNLKLQNNTGSEIGTIDIAYTLYVLNDQDRSNSFIFAYSLDNVTYLSVTGLDYASPEASDLTPYIIPEAGTISGLTLADGDIIYFRWKGNDVSGSGSRDEFALDDISITATSTSPLYSISTPDVIVNEGDLAGTFDVSLTEAADCTIHFGYDPAATATPGFDYGLTGFTLDFTAAGPATQTVTYGLVDDVTAEGTETGIILITYADGGCLAGPDTAIVITIEDNELVTPPVASFTEIGALEDESIGTITGTIELTEAADCELQMTLDGATTMTEGADYSFTLPANFIFTAAGATSQTFDIDIIDDAAIETTEMLLMNLNVISGTCELGVIADFEINITDNDLTPPLYTVHDIADVTTEDVDGIADSIGAMVDLTGIVYGVNLWDGGLQFTLIDATAGISVFNFDNDFGYTVTEGDEVEVMGTIDQFNGLTEIIADTLIYNSSDNTLKTPTNVSDLNEDTESDLVKFDLSGYHINDTGDWLGDGTSFNVDVTDGTNTFTIRIDNNTELSMMSISDIGYLVAEFPDLFVVTGLGSQFDTDLPYNSDYEIMPRYLSDIILEFESISQLNPTQINIYPNPTTDNLILSGKENINSVEIINQLGQTINTVAVNNFSTTISVKNIPAGYYYLKIKTDSGIYSSDFVKQ